jgi:tetratricopeptide (TPR) repeat protein
MHPRITLLSLALLAPIAMYAQAPPLPPGTTADEPAAAPTQPGPLTEAESAIDAKNYDKARQVLTPYLAAHPGDARALFDRGYCDDAQGHAETAEGFYRQAIAADPKQFEATLALGLLLAQGGSEEAAKQLETATTLEPNPPNPAAKAQAWRALARLTRTQDPDTAKQALLEALKLTPETVGDTLLTAEIAESEGDSGVAEQAYRRVLNMTSQDGGSQASAATAGLAHLLIAEKKYSEAEPLLKAALTRDPDDPALNTQYAAVLAAQGKNDEALASLEKLHRAEPNDRSISTMLADAYVQGSNYEKADAVYVNLLAASPNDPELLSARGQVLIREQNYPEALNLFQRAVKLRQDDSDAWGGIAFAASQTHQFQVVIDALTMRSKLAAETPATYFLWATAHDNLHHTKQAVEYYRLFLKSALGKFPDEEWQANQRLAILDKK